MIVNVVCYWDFTHCPFCSVGRERLAVIVYCSFVICEEAGELRGKICLLLGVLLLHGNKYWRSTLREAEHAALSFKEKTTPYNCLQV